MGHSWQRVGTLLGLLAAAVAVIVLLALVINSLTGGDSCAGAFCEVDLAICDGRACAPIALVTSCPGTEECEADIKAQMAPCSTADGAEIEMGNVFVGQEVMSAIAFLGSRGGGATASARVSAVGGSNVCGSMLQLASSS